MTIIHGRMGQALRSFMNGLTFPNMSTREPSTSAWLAAIARRSYTTARALLPPDQDVNVRGAGGATALHVVARSDSQARAVKKIRKLLRDGGGIGAVDDEGLTPLQVARSLQRTEVVECLILQEELRRSLGNEKKRKHSKRKLKDEVRGRIATLSARLLAAARAGAFRTVQEIVESGEITVDAQDNATGETAFSVALATGHRRICDFLLYHGADVSAPCVVDNCRQSALVTAVSTGDVDFVRRVVARGALLHARRTGGMTCPLGQAAKAESIEMVDLLLQLGIRHASYVNGRDLPWPLNESLQIAESKELWSLLTLACWYERHHLVEHLFMSQDELRNRERIATKGAGALVAAVYKQNEPLVIELLDRGVSVNARLQDGVTALVAAVAVNSLAMVRLLLSLGGDAGVVHKNRKPNTGFSCGLLYTALSVGAIDCAFELLPLETRPYYQGFALAKAATAGEFEFVRRFLDLAPVLWQHGYRYAVSQVKCPLMLDLLLSELSDEQLPSSTAKECFRHACQHQDIETVSIFLAHGIQEIDYDHDRDVGSPVMDALLYNDHNGIRVARLLLESGEDVVMNGLSMAAVAARLEQQWSSRDPTRLEASRNLLIEHGALL